MINKPTDSEKIVKHARILNKRLHEIYLTGFTGIIEVHCKDGIPRFHRRLVSEPVEVEEKGSFLIN